MLPQSVMSPVSTTTSMLNCCTTVCTTDHAAGFRCMSEMCSTRIVLASGEYTGSADTVP